MQESDIKPEGSTPKYAIKTETDVYVTMRDGTQLATDVLRPDHVGRFPALVACGP